MAEVMPSGGNNTHPLGRGLQGADNKAGNSGVKTLSTTRDLRDSGPAAGDPINAKLEVPPVRPGRGLHDSSKLGG